MWPHRAACVRRIPAHKVGKPLVGPPARGAQTRDAVCGATVQQFNCTPAAILCAASFVSRLDCTAAQAGAGGVELLQTAAHSGCHRAAQQSTRVPQQPHCSIEASHRAQHEGTKRPLSSHAAQHTTRAAERWPEMKRRPTPTNQPLTPLPLAAPRLSHLSQPSTLRHSPLRPHDNTHCCELLNAQLLRTSSSTTTNHYSSAHSSHHFAYNIQLRLLVSVPLPSPSTLALLSLLIFAIHLTQ